MTERENLTRELLGILFECGCLDDKVKSQVILALDKYEITKRSTEIVPVDEVGNQKLIEDFATAKAVAGRSPKSIAQYVRAVERFVRITKIKLLETTAGDIEKYFAYRIVNDKMYGYGLVNERDYLSSFFDWAVRAELILRNPVKQTEAIKLAKKPKKAFTEIECEKIRNACTTLREKAMVEILFSTACRVSELAGMLIANIREDRVLICGKGKKYADVYLNPRARCALDRYMETRDDDNPYLFPGSAKGSCMSIRNIERILKKIGERAGVSDVYVHKFRRTAATISNKRGMPIEIVKEYLRHENIQTTMKYLDLSEDELVIHHRKYAA